MTNKDLYNLFKIEDLLDLPNAIMLLLEGDINVRNEAYLKLLELNNYDVSYDWFQAVYSKELAQRADFKQDFTPNSVSKIVSLLTGNSKGWIYEPTAGNGSMIIADWWNRCLNSDFPLMHFPSDHLVQCCELSSRAIPILLLNLSIRGMMGYVYHGEVLEQKLTCKYILLNKHNDTLEFSDIIKDEENKLFIRDTNKKISYKPEKFF